MDSKIKIHSDPCFERIRKTLMLEGRPDRIPLCDFGIADNIMEWVIDRPLSRVEYRSGEQVYRSAAPDEILEFWLKAGYDYVHLRPFYNFNLHDVRQKEGSILTEGMGIIQTLEDLHATKWPWQKHNDFCFDHIRKMAKILPEEMKLILSTGDIFTHTWESMGFVHFCNSLYECPELIEELFRQIGEANYLLNERMVEAAGDKVGAIWYTDDLAFNTGCFVNPGVYRQYLYPWVKKIGDLAKSLQVPFLYHTDGSLWEIFDDFAELGVNAIHPLEPKSMEAEEVKQKQGHRFCLIGNIDVDRLSRGTPEEINLMVKERIEKLGYNGGYCVGSSNTIAPYVRPENFKAMVEAAFQYGTLR